MEYATRVFMLLQTVRIILILIKLIPFYQFEVFYIYTATGLYIKQGCQ